MPESYKNLPKKECVSKMISWLTDKYGEEWSRAKIIAVALDECGVSKEND